MPGYGIAGPEDSSGLLPWSWAEERLTVSHDYWVSTIRPDGRPHVMPVWGIWMGDALWFGSGRQSRKVRNLERDPRCAIATDNALQPVVLEGVAETMTERPSLEAFVAACNAKYESADMTVEFMDPAANACLRVRPVTVFALSEDDFLRTPTRWRWE